MSRSAYALSAVNSWEELQKADSLAQNIAAYLGIFIFVVLNILLYRSEKHKKTLKKQAEENGTYVTAHLSEGFRHRERGDGESYCYGEYKYTANGKEKTYRVHFRNMTFAPDTIRLYPKNREETRFFSDHDNTTAAAIGFNGLAAIAAGILSYMLMQHFLIAGFILPEAAFTE